MASDDPDFEQKAADVIGLYVNPPDHAVVFAVDEKTAIQALDRLDLVLPLSPGRAKRHGFEYYRHGTLSLFAALNTQSGEVLGQTVPRHTSAAFVDFLGDIVASQPRRREIHVIADNLSTHKTQAVRTFLLDHPNVQLHFTPTYSSWLNQVELSFSKIERDLLARGIFTLRRGPGPQDPSLYPALQQSPEADPVGVSQSGASNRRRGGSMSWNISRSSRGSLDCWTNDRHNALWRYTRLTEPGTRQRPARTRTMTIPTWFDSTGFMRRPL